MYSPDWQTPNEAVRTQRRDNGSKFQVDWRSLAHFGIGAQPSGAARSGAARKTFESSGSRVTVT